MVENKQQKYQCVFDAFSKWLKDSKSQDEEEQQEKLCCLLSKQFGDKMSFVGFYDAKAGDTEKIYIGQYFTNADIFPCGEIKYGSGQCGLCAQERRTLIAEDTKKLKNYIACDDDTRSEIVVPVFDAVDPDHPFKDGKGPFRTQLDVDSPDVGTFDKHD